VQLRDLTLTRADGARETHRPGLRIVRSHEVTIAGVQVLENWGDLASIFGAYCTNLTVRDCTIRNYSRIAIDDRTAITYLGYAFNCINGSGLIIRHSNGTRLFSNRIVEERMRPTPELQARYRLGHFVKKAAVRGEQVPQKIWDDEYFPVWRQGAGLQISVGETTDYAQVIGNYLECPALGIDIHGDHVIVAQNIVHDAFVGMKAMHGSRNVLISGNQFSAVVYAGIRLMPGSESYAALSAAEADRPDPEDFEGQTTWLVRRPGANIDGHSIVANNIISDFGYGHSHWIWADKDPVPLLLNGDQRKPDIPPLRDVIVSGNIIQDIGRDQVLVDGKPRVEPPRYRYAVKVAEGIGAPQNIKFADNLFHPGTEGIVSTDPKRQISK